MNVTDEVLRLAVAGDADATQALVRQYHDRVYRFGVRVCRDAFDADDAVQLAFITLARRPDIQRSSYVAAWLFRVVRNTCVSMLEAVGLRRSVSLEQSTEAHDVEDASLTAEQALERFELISRVQEAIATLGRDERAALILRDLEGLSGEEAAARLGVSLPALKSRLHRARAAVRARLTPHVR